MDETHARDGQNGIPNLIYRVHIDASWLQLDSNSQKILTCDYHG